MMPTKNRKHPPLLDAKTELHLWLSMDRDISHIEIHNSKINSEHGLCDAAETHWAIYLIYLINTKTKTPIHTLSLADGKEVRMIKKGEVGQGSGFSFGAESYLIIKSDDPSLQNMLLVEESPDVFVGRPLEDLSTSLENNGFYDPGPKLKWKAHIDNFIKSRGISPQDLSLSQMIEQCVGD